MKYIRNYKVFENNTELTDDQKDFLEECTFGTWEVNPDTGLIDVDGSFNCQRMNLNDFKGLRFGKVTGFFACNYNILKTLDGSPREVGGSFFSNNNPLISLEEAPLEVRDGFWFDDFYIAYNPNAFFQAIKKNRSGAAELLFTHHFCTPEAIKHKLEKDDKFCLAVGRAWNTKGFENKRIILENPSDPNGLSPETIQKIKDYSAISGYL